MSARKRPGSARGAIIWVVAGVTILLAATGGCVQTTPHIARIGLVAPFEGRYREIGYDVIAAARLAIREWAAEAPHGRQPPLVFELVSYDDGGDPAQAIEQARKLAVDPDVEAVVGHWRAETTRAALPVYQEAGLPVFTFTPAALEDTPGVFNLSPSQAVLADTASAWLAEQGGGLLLVDESDDVIAAVDKMQQSSPPPGTPVVGGPVWGLHQFHALAGDRAEGATFVTGAPLPADAGGGELGGGQLDGFVAGYQASSLGADPGPFALPAYQATWLAMAYVARAWGMQSADTPVSHLTFSGSGRRLDAPVYLYRWENGRRVLVEQLR